MTSNTVFYAGVAAIVLGTVAGLLPMSASNQRRCYWTGAVVGVALLFVGTLPDWRSALFVSLCATLVVITVAWRFTSHLKVGGRVYAFMRVNR